MGPGMPPPPPREKKQEPKFEKPKKISEWPQYLCKVISDFFFRLFYIFRLVWDANKGILFLMVFMCIYNGISPVISALIGGEMLNRLTDAFMGNALFEDVMLILVIQFGYMFFNSVISNINGILTRVAGEVVTNNIQLKVMNKAKEIDVGCFDLPEFYEKFENASREAGNRPMHIMNSTFSILSTIISMVSYIVLLWSVAYWAPLLIVITAIPNALVNFAYRKKNFWFMRWRSKDRRQMNYYSGLLTNKDMVKELRIFGLSDLFIGEYQKVFKRYFAELKKLIVSENLWHIAISLLSNSVNCFLYIFMAQKVCVQQIQIGDFSLYTAAIASISAGVITLINTSASIYEGTLFIDNMIAFMGQEKTIVSCLPEPVKVERHVGHTIRFENVSFRYPGTERDVLKNLNFTINAGDTVVLVGLNGAGKTTLIKLLTRLYDPTEGTIYLDGRDIRDYDVEELYKLFGIIFQDFGKYAMNIRENIHFGQVEREVVDSEIKTAAEQSDADDFISRLTDGYDTPLMRYFEDNGIELSIGQWQKLAIARAFYSDSDILILDEPTASLDPLAEQEIFNQFDRLREDKTTIFVSHRLSSATVATKILVLEYGEIIEEGRHLELMQKKGRYYELFSTQAKRYITTEDEQVLGAEEAGTPSLPPRRPHPELTQGEMPPRPPRGSKPSMDGRPPLGFHPPMKPQPQPKARPEGEEIK